MQQFIPFEDDWDALEQLRPEALIPYRVGYVSGQSASFVPLLYTPAQSQDSREAEDRQPS